MRQWYSATEPQFVSKWLALASGQGAG